MAVLEHDMDARSVEELGIERDVAHTPTPVELDRLEAVVDGGLDVSFEALLVTARVIRTRAIVTVPCAMRLRQDRVHTLLAYLGFKGFTSPSSMSVVKYVPCKL